ncbi:MAG: acetyl-CoA carboxylase biotin carboxyl carrier protein subunit [Defluviitaleaceae bacterium]|nr:acetyl-CoA carboxylase biotin carboxyl carrier protein subunit [Defluviitaleaceae bacterium]
MDTSKIKELAELLNSYDLTKLKIKDEASKVTITLEKAKYNNIPADVPQVALSTTAEAPVGAKNIKEIKSPMVGVFYAAHSEGSPPFVTAGSKVKKGDILGIIESMKLMNDIHCGYDGEIAHVCVANGDVVEYGQTLFKVKI